MKTINFQKINFIINSSLQNFFLKIKTADLRIDEKTARPFLTQKLDRKSIEKILNYKDNITVNQIKTEYRILLDVHGGDKKEEQNLVFKMKLGARLLCH